MTTPAELVYERIWDVLGDFSESGVKVRPGNLVDYSQLKPKDKSNLASSADMPEIKCVAAGSRWDTDATSSSMDGEIQQFDLVIHTGELNIREMLKLKWYVRQKLWSIAKTTGYADLLYRAEPFCRRIQYSTVFEGLREQQAKIVGWTSVITLESHMEFTRNQMTFISP